MVQYSSLQLKNLVLNTFTQVAHFIPNSLIGYMSILYASNTSNVGALDVYKSEQRTAYHMHITESIAQQSVHVISFHFRIHVCFMYNISVDTCFVYV